MPICLACGDEVEEVRYSEINGQEVCEDCFNDVYCPVCDDVCAEGELIYCITRGEHVCENCNNDEFCPECEEYFAQGTLVFSYTENGYVCSDCLNDSFCEECNEQMGQDDVYYTEGDYGPLCRDCWEEQEESGNCIAHSYSYRPSPIFHHLENGEERRSYSYQRGNVYLGIEIEMKYKNSTPNEIDNVRRNFDPSEMFVYHKEDSSLCDCSEDPGEGVESVSHPMTLDYFMQFDEYWDYIEKMRKEGARGDTPKCGIHIHFSRKGMDKLHRSKLHLFFMVNKDYVKKLARRNSKNYAKFYNRRDQSLSQQLSMGCDRYSHVNWQNSATGEVRVFKSTLNSQTIKAYLQFVDAVYWFTSKHILYDCTSFNSWLNFYNWIKKQPRYSHLVEYFQERKEKLIPSEVDVPYYRDWFSFVTATTGKFE